ncbi:MAG: hemin uptake protein HemP [Spongiibacteraceae bacterium]
MDRRHNNSTVKSNAGAATAAALQGNAPVLFSRELFRDTNTVQIEHEGECYLLRLTRGNKLILTK